MFAIYRKILTDIEGEPLKRPITDTIATFDDFNDAVEYGKWIKVHPDFQKQLKDKHLSFYYSSYTPPEHNLKPGKLWLD